MWCDNITKYDKVLKWVPLINSICLSIRYMLIFSWFQLIQMSSNLKKNDKVNPNLKIDIGFPSLKTFINYIALF